MNEAFDSWKGFKDAGFEETTNDRLRLGSGRCFCAVNRLQNELGVHFEPGVCAGACEVVVFVWNVAISCG